ncbi:MAG: acyl-CoA dehydrogenase N-terminal domain-containing protein, partial [Desulfovermiculus sp.]|nr:acyl-CoA dehydrogenase N-terminal domain-containing protein [Desulfovermiculus sp.]
MAQQIADRRDVDFVLHELLDVGAMSSYEKFAEFNKKTVDLIVTEARNLAIKEILPTNKVGDEVGVSFEKDGQVKVPEEFHRAYQLYKEGEWVGTSEDPEWGGQGMPRTVDMAVSDYLLGANCSLNLYVGLTIGAGHLVEAFGTEEQKRLFLKKL